MAGNSSDKKQLSDATLDELYHEILQNEDKASDHAANPKIRRIRVALDLFERVRDAAQLDTAEEISTLNDGLDASFGSDGAMFPLLPTDVELPESLGRFQIIKPLGQGGFGMVFLAHDPNLKRDVALKIPRPEAITTPALKERFLREGRAAAALAHPNVVPVFESGQLGAICFLASEFIDGESLDQWAANQDRVSPTEAAEICLAIVEGLAHAHQRGVLHRDIKPSNILVARRKNDEPISKRIRITDFGLAKQFGDDSQQTQTGALIGTPSYMSPEQASQTTATLKSDIYSVGAVLYFLLTNRPPFLRSNIVETISAVVREQPVAPIKYNASLPRDLESVCLKCLEKNPDQRYESAFDLTTDLRCFLTGNPVSARRAGTLERCARWTRANRTFALAISSVFAILTLASVLSTYFWINADADRKLAQRRQTEVEAQTKIAMTQTARLQAAIQELFTEVANEPKLNLPEMDPFRARLFVSANKLMSELVSEQPDDPKLRKDYADTFIWASKLYYRLGFNDDALLMLEEAEKLNESEPSSSLAVSIKSVRGQVFLQQKKSDEALKIFDEVVQALELRYKEGAGGVHQSVELLEAISAAGGAAYETRQIEAATRYNQREIELLTEIHGKPPLLWPPDIRCANCLISMAELAYNRRDFDEAEVYGILAAEMFDEMDPDSGKSAAHLQALGGLLRTMGTSYSYKGDGEKAESLFAQAEQILSDPSLEDRFKAADAVLALKFDRALVAQNRMQLDKALDMGEAAMRYARVVQDRFPKVYQRHMEFRLIDLVANIHQMRKEYDLSEEKRKQAMKICSALIANDPENKTLQVELAAMMGNQTLQFVLCQQYPETIAAADETLALCGKLGIATDDFATFRITCNALANKYVACEALYEALVDQDTNLSMAIETVEQFVEIGNDDNRYNYFRGTLARLYCEAEQFDSAFALLEEMNGDELTGSDRFQLAQTLARAAESMKNREGNGQPFKRIVAVISEILQDLIDEEFEQGDQEMADLILDQQFDSIRDEEGFPNSL